MDSAVRMYDMYDTMLENILQDPSEPAVSLPLEFFKAVTDNFSEDRIIGRGGFGEVYKGILRSGKVIAVKKIYDRYHVHKDNSLDELSNVLGIMHPNVVQLIGYCAETKMDTMTHDGGKLIVAEIRSRLLCFEYISNGSLDTYISNGPTDLGWGWEERYRTIKSICRGLQFLHDEWHIVHLELGTRSILMDDDMVPKISEFGLSMLLGDQSFKIIYTECPTGSTGYKPPEYINHGEISYKVDIFSLGVIMIEIITGSRNNPMIKPHPKDYNQIDIPRSTESCLREFTENVLTRWKKIFEASKNDAQKLEICSQQVEHLIHVALKCMDKEPGNRPSAMELLKLFEHIEEGSLCDSNCPHKKIVSLDGSSPVLGKLTAKFIKEITFDFSPAQELGHSVLGIVYKGILPEGGMIAVNRLSENPLVSSSKTFDAEVINLMVLQHQNIVHLVGFCHEVQKKEVQHNGRNAVSDKLECCLCYEYLSKGSLLKYVNAPTSAIDWDTRFKIIKGICQGLHYLHKELHVPIIHMNLAPNTIWLDDNWEPKIADFGFSRLFDIEQTGMDKIHVTGQIGYMAPEYSDRSEISTMSDIYSLGLLIIEIITGENYTTADRASRKFIYNVRQNWTDDEYILSKYPAQGIDGLQQVKECILVGLKCVDLNPEERPSILDIVQIFSTVDKEKRQSLVKRISEVNTRRQEIDFNILERIVNGDQEPTHLSLPLLQSITENFSDNKKIGNGGCGDVYKGTLPNGVVAVKRLFSSRTIKEKMFHREVQSLITVRHQNIVRFLGYCSFTEENAISIGGRFIMADIRERLLCFEYLSNGSLENHLTDELRGLDWYTRYEIIVGICKGLLYLHKEKNITHMDLKPANILLDDQMVPKITDFGLSRLDNSSQTTTISRLISPGYSAPEYISEGISTTKSDIYSLGIIILDLVSGSKRNSNITQVLRRWRHRWVRLSIHSVLGYQQVTKCLNLAHKCMQRDPRDRPDISEVIDELNKIDRNDDKLQVIHCLEDMLEVKPLEIHFPIEEHDQQILQSIELTNDTGDYFAFITKTKLHRLRTEPDKGIVPQQSKCTVTVTLQPRVNALPNNHYKEVITVLSTRVDGSLAAMDITEDMFTDEGKVVDEVNVMVVFGTSSLAQES